eukprot:TRINITY_DN20963_c0_g1_i1.p1 TRINITY_DN20963_c0_g1~~TRINITY_DN20963_c0_g1_i1.p1  ORF type:complete len:921 (+),score=136.27 TRINITY_DN20963_c0_g1_i1:72-2765(+)
MVAEVRSGNGSPKTLVGKLRSLRNGAAEIDLRRRADEEVSKYVALASAVGLPEVDRWVCGKVAASAREHEDGLTELRAINDSLATQSRRGAVVRRLLRRRDVCFQELLDVGRFYGRHTFGREAAWMRATEAVAEFMGVTCRLCHALWKWRDGLSAPVAYVAEDGRVLPGSLLADARSIAHSPLRWLHSGFSATLSHPLLLPLAPHVARLPLRRGAGAWAPVSPPAESLPCSPIRVGRCARSLDGLAPRPAREFRSSPRRRRKCLGCRAHKHASARSQELSDAPSPAAASRSAVPSSRGGGTSTGFTAAVGRPESVWGPRPPPQCSDVLERVVWAEAYIAGEGARQGALLHDTIARARCGAYLPFLRAAADSVRPPKRLLQSVERKAMRALLLYLEPPPLTEEEEAALAPPPVTRTVRRSLRDALHWHDGARFRLLLLRRLTVQRRLRRTWDTLCSWREWRLHRMRAAEQLGDCHGDRARAAAFWRLRRYARRRALAGRHHQLAACMAVDVNRTIRDDYYGKLLRRVARRRNIRRQGLLMTLAAQQRSQEHASVCFLRWRSWVSLCRQVRHILKSSSMDMLYRYYTRLSIWPTLLRLPDIARKWKLSRLERLSERMHRASALQRWALFVAARCEEKELRRVAQHFAAAAPVRFRLWRKWAVDRRRGRALLARVGAGLLARVWCAADWRIAEKQAMLGRGVHGDPQHRTDFTAGMPVTHVYRGDGVVVDVTDAGVRIRYEEENAEHTYKDCTLAKGAVTPTMSIRSWRVKQASQPSPTERTAVAGRRNIAAAQPLPGTPPEAACPLPPPRLPTPRRAIPCWGGSAPPRPRPLPAAPPVAAVPRLGSTPEPPTLGRSGSVRGRAAAVALPTVAAAAASGSTAAASRADSPRTVAARQPLP